MLHLMQRIARTREPPTLLSDVVIDEPTARRGTVLDFVENFTACWADPPAHLHRFLDPLSPDVRLIAPLGNVTRGRRAGQRWLRKTFAALPDLHAVVDGWAASEATLFIEMRFRASVGGSPLEWPNVDRFLFVDGLAVERVAYMDPLPVVRAALARPTGWPQLLRVLCRNGC